MRKLSTLSRFGFYGKSEGNNEYKKCKETTALRRCPTFSLFESQIFVFSSQTKSLHYSWKFDNQTKLKLKKELVETNRKTAFTSAKIYIPLVHLTLQIDSNISNIR